MCQHKHALDLLTWLICLPHAQLTCNHVHAAVTCRSPLIAFKAAPSDSTAGFASGQYTFYDVSIFLPGGKPAGACCCCTSHAWHVPLTVTSSHLATFWAVQPLQRAPGHIASHIWLPAGTMHRSLALNTKAWCLSSTAAVDPATMSMPNLVFSTQAVSFAVSTAAGPLCAGGWCME
jgi:hypothetical protein